MPQRCWLLAALALLTALGYWYFPGHTYLGSDTQIYAPILEHLLDPNLLAKDLVAERPHVAYTVYDEAALLLRRATGWSFETVLVAQQLLYRLLGLWGVYLLARATGAGRAPALFVAACFGLGATINGPAVLTIEYEPVPRGYAIGLLLLALGLCAQGRWHWAALAGSIAFLYHAPTALPFWLVYAACGLWRGQRRQVAGGMVMLLAAATMLFLLSRPQVALGERQPFFDQIEPAWEQLQRMRASYNWISLWPVYWRWHYPLALLVAAGAAWRIRRRLPAHFRPFVVGLPVFGLLSIPLSLAVLEGMKWSLVPQWQPARAALFITAMAVILSALAAVFARRWPERLAWLLFVYLIPAHRSVFDLFTPALLKPDALRQATAALLLALVSTGAFWLWQRQGRMGSAALLGAMLLPIFLLPGWAGVHNYGPTTTPAVEDLSTWAAARTARDAVFAFPDAKREMYPGIFRAHALRAVYVDWKGGGQVNYMRAFAREWWTRWQSVMLAPVQPLASYGKLGIDFVVLQSAHKLPGVSPVFSNEQFVAYSTR